MNLRDAAASRGYAQEDRDEHLSFVQRATNQSQSQVSELRFTHFVGTMGADLDHSLEAFGTSDRDRTLTLESVSD